MGFFDLLALSLAVGVDTLSVSLGLGVAGPSQRRVIQFGTAFAMTGAFLVGAGYYAAAGLRSLFEFLTQHAPIGGLPGISPERLHEHVHLALSLVAAALLCGIGLHLIFSRVEQTGVASHAPFPVRGPWGLLWLGTLVSLDAASAGASLGMLNAAGVIEAVVVFGLVNGGMALFGLGIGRRLHRLALPSLRQAGGVVLIAVAIKLALSLVS